MERTEWPTREHLAELREEGLAPISIISLRGVAALSLAAAAAFVGSAAGRFLEIWREQAAMGELSGQAIEELASLASRLLFAPVAAAALLVVLAGLLQTRFMVRFERLALKAERFSGFKFFHVGAVAGRAAAGLIVISLSAAGAVYWFRYLLPLVLSLPAALQPETAGDLVVLVARGAAMWIVPGLAAIAVVAWVGSRLHFMHTHRMTRREVEAEVRQ